MERIEAEKQACAKVARRKWTERKVANKADVAFGQVDEGRGARSSPRPICKRQINTEIKDQHLVMALQLPD